jgi:hypothetical protein
MKRTLLITNANSGSATAVSEDVLLDGLRSGGFEIVGRVTLPEDELPDRAFVEAKDVEAVAIVSGDGTINSLCEKLAGWQGSLLVLPGGTMNLLSRRLHGELALPDVLLHLRDLQPGVSPVPIIRLGDKEILTGLTVGPSTRWGEVREVIRQGDVAALKEMVPAAWSETLANEGVWIEGRAKQAYAGVFVEPIDSATLSVIAFRANNIGDMVGHGLAWLRRDFRDGPHDDLGAMSQVTILGDDDMTGVLLDGEYGDHPLPISCWAAKSSVQFLRIAQ